VGVETELVETELIWLLCVPLVCFVITFSCHESQEILLAERLSVSQEALCSVFFYLS
jgi:hypothetical protein